MHPACRCKRSVSHHRSIADSTDIHRRDCSEHELSRLSSPSQRRRPHGHRIRSKDGASLCFGCALSLQLSISVLRTTDKARRTRSLAEQATCTFECTTDDTDDIDGLPAQPDIVLPGRQHSFHRSLVIAPRDAQSRGSGVDAEHVDFGQYVDEVSPSPWSQEWADVL